MHKCKFLFEINGLILGIFDSITVIAKIKGMARSLFYDIPCYVTKDFVTLTPPFLHNVKKAV